jgi:MFS superfamily sulfate permease-like transporter
MTSEVIPLSEIPRDMEENYKTFKSIARWNWEFLRANPLGEVSGSLGDLGTLLPILIALAQVGAIDLATTLVFTGLASILAGAWFGYPLAVQPMKAIAGIVLTRGMGLRENMAAGLTTGAIVAIVSVVGIQLLLDIIPLPVVRGSFFVSAFDVVGIQMGAGAILVINSATQLSSLGWDLSKDNLIYAALAFCLYYSTADVRRLPHALMYFVIGITVSIVMFLQTSNAASPFGIWKPHVYVPSIKEAQSGMLNAGIGQVPLTLINSIVAVVFLPPTLYRSSQKPSIPVIDGRTLGLFIGAFNLVGCWFGAMPICFGSGGLAANYRFGARSGSSSIIFGLFKLTLGLFFSYNGVLTRILLFFPHSILGVMLFFAGFELLGVGWNLNLQDDVAGDKEMRGRWDVMAITMGLVIALRNDLTGLLGGCLAWGLHTQKMRKEQGHIQLS